jgi:hypothetical protein
MKTSTKFPRMKPRANTCRPPAVVSGFAGVHTEGVTEGRGADDSLQLSLHLLLLTAT